MGKFQCYYNETILNHENRKYIGKRVDKDCFATEEEAEKYCNTHVGIQKCSDGRYIENEMKYEEIRQIKEKREWK